MKLPCKTINITNRQTMIIFRDRQTEHTSPLYIYHHQCHQLQKALVYVGTKRELFLESTRQS